MINKPSVTELLTKANNRYELVIATSRRARQIARGVEPFTKVDEKSPVTIAANEIAEGSVKIYDEDGNPMAIDNEEEIEETKVEEAEQEENTDK